MIGGEQALAAKTLGVTKLRMRFCCGMRVHNNAMQYAKGVIQKVFSLSQDQMAFRYPLVR